MISWDHELDEWLNPHLTEARTSGAARDALELAAEIEARHPQVQVTVAPLAAEPGHSLAFWAEPRVDPATGRLFEPGFNQVFIDPASGEELGKREWGAVWPVTSENFVSFLYKLHFSLHLPEMGGTDRWGIWLLGVVALLWTVDCFTGVALTLPARRRARSAEDDAAADEPAPTARGFWQRWRPSWRVRWRGGAYKLNFDLHRAGSLWTWALLFLLAFTAFSLNLYREVFFPAMSLVSDVTPSPFDLRQPNAPDKPIAPGIDLREALALARDEAQRRGWSEPAAACSIRASSASMGCSTSIPRTATAPAGWGTAPSTWTAPTAACWVIASPGRGRLRTSSCRRSFRCTPAASLACRGASSSPPWAWWWPCSASPGSMCGGRSGGADSAPQPTAAAPGTGRASRSQANPDGGPSSGYRVKKEYRSQRRMTPTCANIWNGSPSATASNCRRGVSPSWPLLRRRGRETNPALRSSTKPRTAAHRIHHQPAIEAGELPPLCAGQRKKVAVGHLAVGQQAICIHVLAVHQ